MIGLIDYGVGNIQSVINSLEFLNISYRVINNGQKIENFTKVILPGVGSFKYAIEQLNKLGFTEKIITSLKNDQIKLLGICLGMQLLFETSEEDGGCAGLGLIKGSVRKLIGSKAYSVPNIGWREIVCSGESKLLRNLSEKPIFYFVHSYACYAIDKNIVTGKLNYSALYDTIVETKNIYATQFHPEKSQNVGHLILNNFAHL
jgi:imidazole glycerol-phosphate synthase subunit HisH